MYSCRTRSKRCCASTTLRLPLLGKRRLELWSITPRVCGSSIPFVGQATTQRHSPCLRQTSHWWRTGRSSRHAWLTAELATYSLPKPAAERGVSMQPDLSRYTRTLLTRCSAWIRTSSAAMVSRGFRHCSRSRRLKSDDGTCAPLVPQL